MAPSSLKKLGAAIAFASAGRVAAHSSPDLLGNVVDAIFGEAPTSTHSHTTSYVTGTSTTVNDVGETTVVVVVGTTICPVTAAEASESSVQATETSPVPVPVPVLTTATSETAAVAATSSVAAASGSGVGSTSVIQSAANSTSVAMTTSTIFATHSSTITACATAASNCNVGDVTTVVVALSTTVCPVTATEGASNSTVSPTASGNVPGFGTSRTGALGATTVTGFASSSTFVSSKTQISSKTVEGSGSSSVRAQSTITSPSVVLTTVSASSTTSESDTSETVLEMATGAPSEYSAQYTDATETVAVPSASQTAATTTNYNSALMSLASSVEASSAEQTGSNGCTGMDCIVVSNSGVKSKMNASGFALVALAGAVFLL